MSNTTINPESNASLSRNATRWYTLTTLGENEIECRKANDSALAKMKAYDSSVECCDADYYNGNLDYNVSMEPSGTKAAELKKLRRIIK